jgi:hypothetical protein
MERLTRKWRRTDDGCVLHDTIGATFSFSSFSSTCIPFVSDLTESKKFTARS